MGLGEISGLLNFPCPQKQIDVETIKVDGDKPRTLRHRRPLLCVIQLKTFNLLTGVDVVRHDRTGDLRLGRLLDPEVQVSHMSRHIQKRTDKFIRFLFFPYRFDGCLCQTNSLWMHQQYVLV